MKIGIYVSFFPRFSETFVQRLILGLLHEGHEVTVFANRRGEAGHVQDRSGEIARRARIVVRGRMPRSPLDRIARAALLLPGLLVRRPASTLRCLSPLHVGPDALSLRPLLDAAPFIAGGAGVDVVHAQYGHLGERLARLKPAIRPRWKLAASFRGSDISAGLVEHGKNAYEALKRRGDLFLPVSEHFRRRLLSLGFPGEKVRVLRSGLDLSDYEDVHAQAGASVSEDRFRIVTVARLTPKKGVDVCLRAVSAFIRHLGTDGRDMAINYDIIGDGPERDSLQALAAELGLAPHVSFHGWRKHSEVIALMRRCHVFLNHSVVGPDGDEEGIPNVLKEAYLCGLPVVATRHAGIPELVEEGVSGLLVAEGDAEAAASALSELYTDPGRRARYAREGRSRVEHEYDISRICRDLTELFSSLSNEAEGNEA